jgi:AcrR family transcriptional regulator
MTNMKSGSRRQYRQTARAEAAERTRRAIMGAAVSLWREQDWEHVTLRVIAERAEVTVQTVLRRFGSKDGIVEACLAERVSGVEEVRDRAQPGDVRSAVEALLAHYERDGDAVLRTLAVEARSPAARRIVDHGRAEHRAWCARVFAPHLPSPRAGSHRARLDAFVAATDIYLWKLLRRDLGRTRQQTRDAFAALLGGLTATRTRERKR